MATEGHWKVNFKVFQAKIAKNLQKTIKNGHISQE